ncbi:hypothetical protein K458DRAFT_409155 [Lentithecium fluviatile CBS 122367]|uniref:SnoaL-like domain-containing protein n=1 Tax=Lentithecium fluviatile CBS 122367 TaxID=1168545 RepID=A0A6G1IIW5_9PLEO|nr:hypothetical protein K458DRAFT_409155 [Lentithecium fluviatile CBS 122367]
MSFPTKPAFIHYGTWDDESRAHECMKWMEQYTHAADRKAWDTEPSSNWFTSDCALYKPTGEVISGGDAAWNAIKEVYAPFSEHLHIPQFIVVWERENGWEMLGVATLYWNLPVPGEGGKVKDVKGKEWDGAGPAAFDFWYRKTDAGIRLEKEAIYADSSAAVKEMVKRGMVKAEDVMK